LAWGRIVGDEIAKTLKTEKNVIDVGDESIKEVENEIFTELLSKNGDENLYTIRKELRVLMDKNVGVLEKRKISKRQK